jgi:hypothetical protein
MKKKLLASAVFAAFFATAAFAQNTQTSTTTAHAPIALLETPTYSIPAPNMDLIRQEDADRDKKGMAYRNGVAHFVHITAINQGLWTTSNDGTRTWKLRIKSKGAQALTFIFSKLILSEGASVWVENESHTFQSKKLSRADMFEDLQNIISLCPGDDLSIVLQEPAEVAGQSVLEIGRIFYNYRAIRVISPEKDFGESDASCEVNVNCTEGNNWQDEKKGVARVLVISDSQAFWCSGSLINNVAADCKPLFLTAMHCGMDASASDLNLWEFYFKYEAPTCTNPGFISGTANNFLSPKGCFRLADSNDGGGASGSDFFLVQLGTANNTATVTANLKTLGAYWNGWDANNTSSTGGVGIHHPMGDIKKISTYTSTTTTTGWNSNGLQSHWRVVWAATANGHGVTEGGSSGSPLFNSNGGNSRIIGTLTGGSSFCNSTSSPDSYGKMSYHWISNGNPSDERLKTFLDPANSGLMVLNGSYDPCLVAGIAENGADGFFQDVHFFPNPTQDILSVDLSTLPENTSIALEVYDMTGHFVSRREVKAGTITVVDLQQLSAGLYQVKLSTGTSSMIRQISKI